MEENNHHFVFLFGSNQQKAFKWPYILIPKNEKMSKIFFSFFLILKFKHCTGTKILHLCTIWRVKSFISSFFHKLTTVGGGCNGAFAPPSQNCYALDIIEFFHVLIQNFNINGFFRQKYPTAPPKTNFWLRHWFLHRMMSTFYSTNMWY